MEWYEIQHKLPSVTYITKIDGHIYAIGNQPTQSLLDAWPRVRQGWLTRCYKGVPNGYVEKCPLELQCDRRPRLKPRQIKETTEYPKFEIQSFNSAELLTWFRDWSTVSQEMIAI